MLARTADIKIIMLELFAQSWVPPHLSLDPAVPRHEVRALVAGAVPHAQVELAGHEVGQVGVTHLQTELVSICV